MAVFVSATQLTISILLLTQTVFASSWHYGKSGPSEWQAEYPDCAGHMQSPIDITTGKVLPDDLLQPFDFHNYATVHEGENVTLVNKAGHTVELDYHGEPVALSGGSLPDSYILDQFHFHWGNSTQNGSEHTIDGKHYPMEMHLVHHQAHMNRSDAPAQPYGLAVVAYFIQIGETNHNFDQLLSHFDEVHKEDQTISFPFLRLKKLIPAGDGHYFRYFGSLTTPPCHESVIWSISMDTISISSQQLNRFQNFINKANRTILNNFRPTQQLHFRRVYSSERGRFGNNSGAELRIAMYMVMSAFFVLLLLFI